MNSHLNSHRTTHIKPEMLSGVQTVNGSPHDKHNIRGIAHARTNRKEEIFIQRRLVQNFTYIMEWGQRTCTLTKRTRRWTYSALRHFFLSLVYFSWRSAQIKHFFLMTSHLFHANICIYWSWAKHTRGWTYSAFFFSYFLFVMAHGCSFLIANT